MCYTRTVRKTINNYHNMKRDATAQEILIGEFYGYSKSCSRFTNVVTGRAVKAENGKVPLSDRTENVFLYVGTKSVDSNPKRTTKSDRKRTLASVQVFHISKHLMIDKNAEKHDCLQ